MASKETPIPFTVGDQERLVKIEKELESMPDKIAVAIGNIQIVHHCDKVDRIVSLETSRERWYSGMRKGVVSVIITGFVGLFAWLASILGIHVDGM